jgi:hypothetical protein
VKHFMLADILQRIEKRVLNEPPRIAKQQQESRFRPASRKAYSLNPNFIQFR